MSKHLIEHATLVGIADTIREHEGTTDPIPVSELNARVKAIRTGVELPELTDPGSASDLLADKQLIDAEGNPVTGTIPSKSAETYTPSTEDQLISSGQYLSGDQTIKGDANLIGENIVEGISIFDVTGTREPASVLADELAAQDDLISQISAALENKTAVEAAVTPVISVDSAGLITATAGSKSATKQLTTQEAKAVEPTTEEQTVVSSGVYTTGEVKVNAMPTAEQTTPSITINSSGLITASATQEAGYVLSGTKSATKQLTTQAAKIVTPSASSQTAVASGVYTTGVVTVAGDSNLVAENIAEGVSIFGVTGSYAGGGASYVTTLAGSGTRILKITGVPFQYSKLAVFASLSNIGTYNFVAVYGDVDSTARVCYTDSSNFLWTGGDLGFNISQSGSTITIDFSSLSNFSSNAFKTSTTYTVIVV